MIRNIVLLIASCFIMLMYSCGPDEVYLKGDFSILEVENRTNYMIPFTLEEVDGYEVVLNDSSIQFSQGVFRLEEAGFYEMIINKTDTTVFVLLDNERGETEWGLKKWTPLLSDFDTHFDGKIEIIHPLFSIEGVNIPYVIKAGSWDISSSVCLKCNKENGAEFLVKYGVGITSQIVNENNQLVTNIAGSKNIRELRRYENEKITLPTIIKSDYEIPSNSLIEIKQNTEIAANVTLVINSGCTMLIHPAINIFVKGNIDIKGTDEAPVLITCNNSDEYFGGFIVDGVQSTISAENSFFTRFGYHSSESYQYGHAKHQALFKLKDAVGSFSKCYFYDSPGQAFYPAYSQLKLDSCVVSKIKTTGEVVGGRIEISNSYLSDFPDDSFTYQNEDNDALYINGADAQISNSMFMFAKDDGIDSGAGGGGIINVDACRFEACFHEGLALSSIEPSVKKHTITNSLFIGCQQGVELGYSSANHSVEIRTCNFERNHIGIRYGDNYKNDVNGLMTVTGAKFSNNDKNYWNMVRQTWSSKPQNFLIH
ncbi:MAG: hypothetical protein PF436_08625 [Prolixibacteraceae bacterium]|jgi:hypothetical protein|nr:hypothetical protein [Prolixibacteraceae bacterium]